MTCSSHHKRSQLRLKVTVSPSAQIHWSYCLTRNQHEKSIHPTPLHTKPAFWATSSLTQEINRHRHQSETSVYLRPECDFFLTLTKFLLCLNLTRPWVTALSPDKKENWMKVNTKCMYIYINFSQPSSHCRMTVVHSDVGAGRRQSGMVECVRML